MDGFRPVAPLSLPLLPIAPSPLLLFSPLAASPHLRFFRVWASRGWPAASLIGADLRVIQMKGAKFHGADLTDTCLTDATGSGYSQSILDLATAEGFDQANFPELNGYVKDVTDYLATGGARELS